MEPFLRGPAGRGDGGGEGRALQPGRPRGIDFFEGRGLRRRQRRGNSLSVEPFVDLSKARPVRVRRDEAGEEKGAEIVSGRRPERLRLEPSLEEGVEGAAPIAFLQEVQKELTLDIGDVREGVVRINIFLVY